MSRPFGPPMDKRVARLCVLQPGEHGNVALIDMAGCLQQIAERRENLVIVLFLA
jgi:hypothetical protein